MPDDAKMMWIRIRNALQKCASTGNSVFTERVVDNGFARVSSVGDQDPCVYGPPGSGSIVDRTEKMPEKIKFLTQNFSKTFNF